MLPAIGSNFRLPITPSTVLSRAQFTDISANVQRFVVCPKCHSLYCTNDPLPACCTYVRFPNHPVHKQRTPCGEPIQKGRNATLSKEFVYSPLRESLQQLFERENFEHDIEKWRNREVPKDTMFDIYDGKMWTEIPNFDNPNEAFVKQPRSLLLTLNVDWFNPFHGHSYSCGAIYITINNLSRAERLKKET